MPRLIDQFVPGEAAMVENILVRGEDPVGDPVISDELPDVFDRIEFGRLCRQGQQRDVLGYGELGREVPTGPI